MVTNGFKYSFIGIKWRQKVRFTVRPMHNARMCLGGRILSLLLVPLFVTETSFWPHTKHSSALLICVLCLRVLVQETPEETKPGMLAKSDRQRYYRSQKTKRIYRRKMGFNLRPYFCACNLNFYKQLQYKGVSNPIYYKFCCFGHLFFFSKFVLIKKSFECLYCINKVFISSQYF